MNSTAKQTIEEMSVVDLGMYCNVHCKVDVMKGSPATVAFKESAQSSRMFGRMVSVSRLGSKVYTSTILTRSGTDRLRIWNLRPTVSKSHWFAFCW